MKAVPLHLVDGAERKCAHCWNDITGKPYLVTEAGYHVCSAECGRKCYNPVARAKDAWKDRGQPDLF